MLVHKIEADDGNNITLVLPEKFDFSIHSDFRNSYNGTNAKKYIVDMKNTSYLDSAALGMLLQLREHAGGNRGAVEIKNVNDNVKDILDIANFSQLMTVN